MIVGSRVGQRDKKRGRQGEREREVTYMPLKGLICSCFTAFFFFQAHTQIHSLSLLSVNDGATKSGPTAEEKRSHRHRQGVSQDAEIGEG